MYIWHCGLRQYHHTHKVVTDTHSEATRRYECTLQLILWFGVVALCFVTTTRVLRSVLGNIFVMVLLCHSSECGCFVCDMIVLWGFPLFLILTSYTYILPILYLYTSPACTALELPQG